MDKVFDKSHKQRAIQYNKNGDERVEYWVVDPEGFIKTCSPQAWLHLKLEDRTTDATLERVAALRYRSVQIQFDRLVDDNTAARAAGMLGTATVYQWLCKRANITY